MKWLPLVMHCCDTAPGELAAAVSKLPLLSNLRLPSVLSMFARCPLSVESRLTVFPLESSFTVLALVSMPTVPVTVVVDVPTCVTGHRICARVLDDDVLERRRRCVDDLLAEHGRAEHDRGDHEQERRYQALRMLLLLFRHGFNMTRPPERRKT